MRRVAGLVSGVWPVPALQLKAFRSWSLLLPDPVLPPSSSGAAAFLEWGLTPGAVGFARSSFFGTTAWPGRDLRDSPPPSTKLPCSSPPSPGRPSSEARQALPPACAEWGGRRQSGGAGGGSGIPSAQLAPGKAGYLLAQAAYPPVPSTLCARELPNQKELSWFEERNLY